MSNEEDYMVRVNFELESSVNRRLQRSVQWGTKGPCLRILATKLVEAVEQHGQVMVGAVLDGNFELVYKPPAPLVQAHPIMGRKRKKKDD